VVKLYERTARKTVANFVGLATGSRNGSIRATAKEQGKLYDGPSSTASSPAGLEDGEEVAGTLGMFAMEITSFESSSLAPALGGPEREEGWARKRCPARGQRQGEQNRGTNAH